MKLTFLRNPLAAAGLALVALMALLGGGLLFRRAQAESPLQAVRVYYRDRQQLQSVANWLEPWEVHPHQGYAVVGVNAVEMARLQQMGLNIEIDERLTALANQPAMLAAHGGAASTPDSIPAYSCYRTVDETYAAAQALAQAYPGLAQWIDIGDSWEKEDSGGAAGRDLMVLRITNQAATNPKAPVFIMAAVHARELVTAELLTRLGEKLLQEYNRDPDITWLLDHRDIHLLLHANPDGRVQAEGGALWRKNTNATYCSGSNQRGADLNRNFAFQWGCCGGSSGNQCAETYRGPSAASEPEAWAIQNYALALFPDQRGPNLTDPAPADTQGLFIDLHSYSQLVLWPWAFSATPAPNAAALQTLGRKFAYYNHYDPSPAYTLYVTDGSTDDYIYGELGVPAFTFEMGTWFFQDCPTFEDSIVPDNTAALLYGLKAAGAPYQQPTGPEVVNARVTFAPAVPGGPANISALADDKRTTSGEAVQNIQAAIYTIDAPPWSTPAPVLHPMQAADGAFDQRSEALTATVNTSGLTTGQHLVFIQAQDKNGNWGTVSAAWLTVPERLFLPLAVK